MAFPNSGDTQAARLCRIIEEAVVSANEAIASISRSHSMTNTFVDRTDNGKDECAVIDKTPQKILQVIDLLLQASVLSNSLRSRENHMVGLIKELSTRLADQSSVIKEYSKMSEKKSMKHDVGIATDPIPPPPIAAISEVIYNIWIITML